MKRLLTLALTTALSVVFAASAGAGADANAVGAAYTISNAAAGNELVVYARASNGSLTRSAAVPAGGLGTGSGLASQSAVALSADGRFVVAVNPGSDSVAAFDAGNGAPRLLGTAASGGNRPVSVTVRKDLVYALNKDNASPATVSGFRLAADGLTPIAGSTRTLHPGATDAAQVKLSPDGATLVVTGRSSQRIDTFPVLPDGRLGAPASFDPTPGAVPFGFDFDNKGHLLMSLAGVGSSSGAASYALGADGTLSTITAPLATGQGAACWLVASKDGRHAYVANAASASVSTFAVSPAGELRFEGALTIPGMTPLDLALSESGRYLYVLAAGTHGIVELAAGADGSLAYVGTETDVPIAAAGLAAR